MAKEENIIKLAGRKYHGETGQLINDAAESPQASGKAPQTASTLNRQYVHKPDIRRAASIKAADNRAQKSEIKQFNREIIAPGKQGPKAPGVTRFHRGDFNQTAKPIILDIKPGKDVVITAEQNQKFIDAVERAKRVDFARRYYAAQISRQRRRKANKIYQTSRNLIKKSATPETKISQNTHQLSAIDRRARQDQIINQAIAETPTSKDLLGNKPLDKFSLGIWLRRHLASNIIVMILLAATTGLLYLNWPNIALNLANRQLGINGHMPAHVVDGFELNGYPAASGQNLVLNYKNQANDHYEIKQSKSSLDSESVLIKIVKPEAGDDYSINRQDGLTVYIFDENKQVIWSNGGILYRISANTSLTPENIYRLSTSL